MTSGNDDQLDELLRRVAVATAPGSSNQVRLLNLLGLRGWQDYVRTGALGALDEAVSQWRAAVENESDGDGTRGVVLNSLAIGLLQQAQPHQADDRAWTPVEEAIATARRAIDTAGAGQQTAAHTWNTLGRALILRHRHTRQFTDLADAVDAFRNAVRLSPPGSWGGEATSRASPQDCVSERPPAKRAHSTTCGRRCRCTRRQSR